MYRLRGMGSKSWEVFADEAGALIFERHREGLESYQCPPAELLNGQPVRYNAGIFQMSFGVYVTRWAVS